MAKKILYITSVGSHWGSEESLLNLIRHIDRDQYEPYVLTVKGSLQEKLEQHKIPYKIYESYTLTKKELINFSCLILRLAYFIRKNKFALIHTNDIHSAQYSIAAAYLARVPAVLHIRNTDLERWLKWKNRVIFKLANNIIAISNAVAISLIKIGVVEKKIQIIPNAVELSKFHLSVSGESFRNEIGIDKQTILVGIVGRIIPKKGQDIFIQAIPEIIKVYSNVKFVIVGEDTTQNGDFIDHLKKMVREIKQEKKVYFVGFKEDIQEIFKALDILVVPSRTEAFGRVVIEAMAVGTPVVATSVGGIIDIIEDGFNGAMVPVNNPKTIAHAVISLIADRIYYQKISQNGRKTVEKYYTIGSHINAVKKLYASLFSTGKKF